MTSRCFAFALSLVLAVIVTASLACAQTSELDELAKLDDLARKSYEKGDYQEAAKLLRQALEIFKTVFPGDQLRRLELLVLLPAGVGKRYKGNSGWPVAVRQATGRLITLRRAKL